MSSVRFAFAGDRDIAVQVLDFLLARNARPVALLLPSEDRASHAHVLAARCQFLPSSGVFRGSSFRSPAAINALRGLNLDYIVGVHFPYVIPQEVLALPREGVLNLHPALLPYNRGWHTPSWAILEGTPMGATLHFMDEGIDTGDIVHQRELEVSPGDTAHSLYERVKQLELEVFSEAWPALAARSYGRVPQDPSSGTFHPRSDLVSPPVQRIDLHAVTAAETVLRRLRALTTNVLGEAAFFEVDGKRYRVQVTITQAPAGSRGDRQPGERRSDLPSADP